MPLLPKVCEEGLSIPHEGVVVHSICDSFKRQACTACRVTFGALRQVRTLKRPTPFIFVGGVIADRLQAQAELCTCPYKSHLIETSRGVRIEIHTVRSEAAVEG